MKPGSFIFDGVDSETIKTLIQSRPLIEAPSRKVEQRSTYGVDGTVPFDEGAYENTDLDLVMFVNGTDHIGDREKIYDLLDTKGIYKELIPYFDPGKIYRVMLNGKIAFENNYMYGERQAFSAKFTVKPYKYLVANDPITINGTSGSVVNSTKYASQPLIKLTGTGAVTLNVNDIPFSIISLPNTIILDSERYLAYQDDGNGVLRSLNSSVGTKDYPLFKPGINTISVTGNVSQIYIEPRWRSLV